jgi:hypothetical protein
MVAKHAELAMTLSFVNDKTTKKHVRELAAKAMLCISMAINMLLVNIGCFGSLGGVDMIL